METMEDLPGIRCDAARRGWTPPPELANGETLPPPEFDATGTAVVAGLRLERRMVRSGDGARYEITLRLTNLRSEPVAVSSLPVIAWDGDALALWDDFKHCVVSRMARQKNDVPGAFHPGIVDAALRNAAFDSSEVVAGGGVAWCEMEAADAILPTAFFADPGMVLTDDGEHFAVFVGFAGQSRHLNQVALETDLARSRMTRLAARAELDGIVLAPGASFETHPLVIERGTSVRALLEAHAERIADRCGVRRSPYRNVFCTWYYYGADIDESEVLANLAAIEREQLAFEVFQIDMGWEDAFGDWAAEPAKFPHGMAAIAAQIRAHRLTPGIWTSPFVVEPQSRAAAEHPDMFLVNPDGSKCRFKCAKGECWILDPFHPEAEAYLRQLFARLGAWGFGYHKLDFLRAVFLHPGVRFCRPDKTRAEAYRHGLEIIREAIGPDSVLNACGGLYEGSAGVADIIRSGFDLRGHWLPENSEISAYTHRIRQNLYRNFYAKLWTVDPDALQIRRNEEVWQNNPLNAHLSRGVFTDDEAFSILVNQFLAGGIACVSERFSALDGDRMALLKQLLPNFSLPARGFGADAPAALPTLLYQRFDAHPVLPPWDMVTAQNWENDEPREIAFSPSTLPGIPAGRHSAVFSFRSQRLLGVCADGETLRLTIPAHGCELLRVTAVEPESDTAFLVGTDGNLSCGMELRDAFGTWLPRPVGLTFYRHGEVERRNAVPVAQKNQNDRKGVL